MNPISQCLAQIDKKYPFTFVDIGAMGGIPSKWDILRKAMRILAFEADEREFAKLKSTEQLKYFNCLVHSHAHSLKFYISKSAGRSSVFAPNIKELAQFPNVDRFHTVQTEEIEAHRVKSMDEIIRENEVSDIDFMKVDTEGTELAIFQGSREKVLSMVFGVQVEVEFVEKCIGQPLFRDVDAFMNGNGFQIMDLRRQFWKRKDFNNFIGKGQLVFGDALYFKRLDALANELSSSDIVYRSSKIYKAVLCCLIYRLFDYAVAIIRMSAERAFLKEEEALELISNIRAYACRGQFPGFPGRKKLHDLISRIAEALRPKSFLQFSDSDKMIGNIKDF